MALSSPGVQVSVIDESFYTPAAPGTVPLIVVASAQDKNNASGTGVAVGTQKANAGKVYLITSQRDLTDTFGTPLFYTDVGGNPIHGGELNEYGLQSAYSLLGVSSRAYVTRADVDLGQLVPQSSAPEGLPVNGTYWLDSTSNTSFGIFEWDKVNQVFNSKTPFVIDNDNMDMYLGIDGFTPKASFGTAGTYTIVATSANMINLWYKNSSGTWVQVGTNTETGFSAGSTFKSTVWQTSFPTVTGSTSIGDLSTHNGDTLVINGQTVTLSGSNAVAMASSINAIMRTHGVNASIGTGGVLQLFADSTAASNGASGAVLQAAMEVATVTLANTGTNYSVGQVLTIPNTAGGSTSSLATVTINTVNTSGSVLTYTISNRGEYTGAIPNSSGAITTVNTGTGTAATLNLTFRVAAVNVTSGGIDYSSVTPPTVSIGGNAQLGSVTVTNGAVTNVAVGSAGSGYTSIPSVSVQNPDVQDGKIKIQVGNTATMLTALGLTAGTYSPVTLFQGPHTQYPDFSAAPSGSMYVKTTSPNKGADWTIKSYNATTNKWSTQKAPIYGSPESAIYGIDPTGDGKNIAAGQLYIEQNYDHGTGLASSPQLVSFEVFRRNATGSTTVKTPVRSQTFTFTQTSTFQIKESSMGAFGNAATITIQPGDTIETVATYINDPANGFEYTSASFDSNTFQLSISHSLGGEVRLNDGTHAPLSALGFSAWARSDAGVETGTKNLYLHGDYDADGFTYHASNWKPLVFESKQTAPYTDPADGTLWYSSVVDQVDIMYHNGTTWVGYRNAFPTTDINGPIVAAVAPTLSGGHSDGSDLVDGDIWIDSSNATEDYGQNIYVWNGTTLKWVKQDPSDQTSPNGWVFANARWATAGTSKDASTIASLLVSNYLDPDAPDPALYPKGTRLWNLRRSGFNVKKYVKDYININANEGKNIRYANEHMDGSGNTTPYVADRWVSVTPNNEDGSGKFGRHAQRGFVVAGLKALIDTSAAIRDTDTLVFNLIATPGYPEVIQNEIALNVDRHQTAFVVGDTPFRLEPTGTALSNWGLNTAGAFDNGDVGGTSYDEYMAMYYPSGYTTDNTGNYIVVPPSHMMLRTIATSDQKSYQWFAPAGTRRGGVDNASSVGYLKDGEFHTTALPESIRDVMAGVKINPIATLTGVGVVAMGQYTRAKNASSLDRVNVARLVAYLRRQLGILAKPFLFEPNDKITRNEMKRATESLLLELVGQRALYDFIVVCDESNNTPSRIDRSELWLDVAIEPVKAVEFIYIPLRLKNTGAIKAGV